MSCKIQVIKKSIYVLCSRFGFLRLYLDLASCRPVSFGGSFQFWMRMQQWAWDASTGRYNPLCHTAQGPAREGPLERSQEALLSPNNIPSCKNTVHRIHIFLGYWREITGEHISKAIDIVCLLTWSSSPVQGSDGDSRLLGLVHGCQPEEGISELLIWRGTRPPWSRAGLSGCSTRSGL